MNRPVERVRIKRGVRPFGGRIVQVHERHTYPNGREVVRVYPPRPVAGWYSDVREFNAHEVEEVTK